MNGKKIFYKIQRQGWDGNLAYEVEAWLEGESKRFYGMDTNSAVGQLVMFYAKNVALNIEGIFEENKQERGQGVERFRKMFPADVPCGGIEDAL